MELVHRMGSILLHVKCAHEIYEICIHITNLLSTIAEANAQKKREEAEERETLTNLNVSNSSTYVTPCEASKRIKYTHTNTRSGKKT